MSVKELTHQIFRRERLTAQRLAITLAVLAIVLIAASVFSIAVGSEHVGFTNVIRVIAAEITGRAGDVSAEQRIIIADIRLPRVLMAIVVGAALAVAGSAYQAFLRNPFRSAARLRRLAARSSRSRSCTRWGKDVGRAAQ